VSVVKANVAPTAAFTHSETDLVANFDASSSSDSDGSIASYSWNFGDGTTGSGKSASHSYAAAGTYSVTLTVTDDKGAAASQSASVSVVAANVAPTAAFTHSEADLVASFDASASSDSDGSIASYSWNFGDGATSSGKTSSHSYSAAGTYSVTLTVTDDKGATASQSASVNVVAANQLPTASFSVQVNHLAVQFDGSASVDADGRIVGYLWNFGEPAVGGENQSAEQKPQHSYQVAGTYTVTLMVTDDRGGEHLLSQSVTVDNRTETVGTGKFNDTGITSCADFSNWSLPCPVADFPGQDAESGRDVSANDDSDGHAGFSFTKVSSSGQPLAASAPEWSCVQDNVTGLLWEIRTDDGGLRDKKHTYSWYNPDATTNGGDAGWQNGGRCSGGILCDTQGYVAAVNAAGLCGYHDWRLPTILELLGLVDYSVPAPGPTIDTRFFPDAPQNWYWWSSSAANSGSAWGVAFKDGNTDYSSKSGSSQLRLVRSNPTQGAGRDQH
ncbi:PKD domain-containing protein, partial [Pseudaeromonas pectinilytica]